MASVKIMFVSIELVVVELCKNGRDNDAVSRDQG
jgi:hypothetical protein